MGRWGWRAYASSPNLTLAPLASPVLTLFEHKTGFISSNSTLAPPYNTVLTLFEHKTGFIAVRVENTVAHKPVTVADNHAYFTHGTR